MPTWVWILIAVMVVAAIVVLIASMAVGRRRRTERLKERFGPEYERTVTTTGAPAAAEKELTARERLHDELDIVALSPTARGEYERRWRDVQASFIDDPSNALREADQLVTRVMNARGYPVSDFERRAADISVEHPTIVEDYRGAHAVSQSQRDGHVDTEAQRQAFVHYRTLFGALLAPDASQRRTDVTTRNDTTPARHAATPEGTRS